MSFQVAPIRSRIENLSFPRWGMLFRFLVTIPLLVCTTSSRAAETLLHREADFQQELDRPLLANRQRVPLREFLNRLSRERSVAILLDRRIDPGQSVDIDVNADYLDEGVREIADLVGASASITGDTIFVTHPATAATLRTRIFLHQQQLDDVIRTDPKRQFQLLRRYPLTWPQLTTPREILQQIANQYNLTIENPELVPHDLWAAGTVSYANATEALLLVLTQFNLEFTWMAPGTIRLNPEVRNPRIQQRHRPRGVSLDVAMQRVNERFPDVAMKQQGELLEVTALLEQHEELAVMMGERPPRRRARSQPMSATLDNKRFTLRMVRQPFTALLQLLRKQGVEIQYDQSAIAAADIDLSQKVSLKLEKATIHQLLSAACGEVGLGFRVEGTRVVLFPEGQ